MILPRGKTLENDIDTRRWAALGCVMRLRHPGVCDAPVRYRNTDFATWQNQRDVRKEMLHG